MNSTRKQMLLIGIKLLDTKYLLSKTHKPLRYKVSHVKDIRTTIIICTKYTPKTKCLRVLFKTNVFLSRPRYKVS